MLFAQGVFLLLQGLLTPVDFGGAPLEFVELYETGLVDVDEPAVFGGGGLGFALESAQLLVKDLVIGGAGTGAEGVFTGEQNFGA